MNGDLLTTLNFQKLIQHHREQGAALTIAVKKKAVKIDLGVIVAGEDGLITDYQEKPELDYLVSMGIFTSMNRACSNTSKRVPTSTFLTSCSSSFLRAKESWATRVRTSGSI